MSFICYKKCRVIFLIYSYFLLSCSIQAQQPVNQAGNILTTNIEELITEQNLPGLVMLVRKNNQIIHHQAYGYADIEAQIPMKKDALFRLNSMTKPITALTTLKVLADNAITLDSPLQNIFPQFGALEDIPLWTVMTHTAGFSYGFKINRWAGWLYLFSDIGDSQTLSEFIGYLAELPLLSKPGDRWRYSFSSDVQGAMVEKITGKKLSENMTRYIFSKLDMQDTSFYVEPARVDRLVPMYSNSWFGSTPNKLDDNHVTQAQGAESGGSGLVSTAQDYSKFVQLLMTPTAYPDIVNTEQVTLMTTSQLPTDIPTIPERYYTHSGYSYGMGIKLENEPFLSQGSFYWAGKGGTIFWADPKKELSVVVMMQYEGGNKILERELIPIVYHWLEQRENITH
jgi:CubicO group peptidase (beta-lactamase class C family)